MPTDLTSERYNTSWGDVKLGKLWIGTSDLLKNGKRPLLPAKSFYSDWNSTAKDLALMTKKILNYLKFSHPYILRVNFSDSLKSPGIFQMKGGSAKITINNKYKKDAVACAAILAHEICHLILMSRDIRENDDYENERLTDFASVFFGLGILILNGKKEVNKTDPIQLIGSILGFLSLIFTGAGFLSKPGGTTQTTSFGYWNPDEYKKIFIDYTERNNLNYSNFSKYLRA